ncbi:long-chain fatty acid--CoA ligase [Sphingosinicella rhizophila]|uniref:Long-chain fatty acid--CoA ligase n=1 Tax=Sphingosinicella rhizophila TaxID=3050082 RepID=A0ABU3QBH8_9SPHN|nr:long-chain fatty acid--CoA ligase [Sphingosinicella sp. GR2756]MDT9600736.1 long-chain fatty acid--CoA ligase [Sphingosinicella sp. GR2756]
MLPGLMQTTPLLISGICRFAATAHPEREIVSRLVDEPIWRYDYAAMEKRAGRAARALAALGIGPGDRVTSLAWNTHRHLELFYGVTGMGAVLHTANPRLSEAQIAYTINHAGSRVLLFDADMLDLVERLRPHLGAVDHYVALAPPERLQSGAIAAISYESLLAAQEDGYEWPTFDENSAAFLCYTSGTTGDPKGVLYSHRAVVLHAMIGGLNGALGFSAFDVIMPCQSLYHATAWGLPFIAPINGCKLVLPGNRMDGAGLHELVKAEGVTFSGGVPTIWTMYLSYLEQQGEDAGTLQRLVIGGSAVPRAMAETFQRQFGVTVRQIWGMTETAPIGVIATPTPKLAAEGEAYLDEVIWTRQGRLQFGIELKIVDEEGTELPHDGESSGALLVRGPWCVRRYYRAEEDAVDAAGWFDTGDIATIDRFGFMRITDRKKDVIKSGGEWISSIDLENIAVACPGVRIAAVVGVFHPKWEERPVLVIETHEDAAIGEADVRDYLSTRIVKWWMPDAILFAPVPLTATGKIDKKVLRDQYKDHLAG